MTNTTNETHTPINLAPGIDLMVRTDLLDDEDTLALVEQLKASFRARHEVQS